MGRHKIEVAETELFLEFARSEDAARLLASPHLRVMGGMLLRCPDCHPWRIVESDLVDVIEMPTGWMPDIYDSATQGCFITRVREAWESIGAEVDLLSMTVIEGGQRMPISTIVASRNTDKIWAATEVGIGCEGRVLAEALIAVAAFGRGLGS